MLLNIVFLVIGFIVLIKGADLFVDGANQTYILGSNTNTSIGEHTINFRVQ